MEPGEKRASQPWWVWASIWAGVILSLFTVILWVLLMDVDSPNLKPRPALENAAACLVYISHTINILTTLLATVALLQEEYPVVLCWALWAIVMAVVQLVLCFVSSFTVLRYVPARLCLHIVSCLLALWAGFVMVQVYRKHRRPRRFHNWESRGVKEVEAHANDISRESNVL